MNIGFHEHKKQLEGKKNHLERGCTLPADVRKNRCSRPIQSDIKLGHEENSDQGVRRSNVLRKDPRSKKYVNLEPDDAATSVLRSF